MWCDVIEDGCILLDEVKAQFPFFCKQLEVRLLCLVFSGNRPHLKVRLEGRVCSDQLTALGTKVNRSSLYSYKCSKFQPSWVDM